MLIRALVLVVGRSLQQHRVAAAITSASIALASAMLFTLLSVQSQAAHLLLAQSGGWDAVLGPRGSPLQLVLALLYHLDSPTGTVPWRVLQTLREDSRVRLAVPLALGDNFRGFRIVGTEPEYFQAWGSGMRLRAGRFFDPHRREAVVGSWVAWRVNLPLGSHFHPSHGLVSGSEEHEEDYEVVGILAPTNSPQDHVLYIPVEGVYRMSGHVLRGAGGEYVPRPDQPIPAEVEELSGVAIKLKGPQLGMQLADEINRQGKECTLAFPVARVVLDFFGRVRWVVHLTQGLTVLVLLVGMGSITASLTNTLHERRKEFAVLRALGASRFFVSAVLVLESFALSVVGAIGGFGVYLMMMVSLTGWLQSRTGVQLDPLAMSPELLVALPLVPALGVLAGVLPALIVYRGSVAPHLSTT